MEHFEVDKVTAVNRNVQESIEAKMKEVYSDTVIDHVLSPRNTGSVEGADGYGKITSSHGDMLEVSLKVRSGLIIETSFNTDSCAATVASGSMITELVKGKSLSTAQNLTAEEVIDSLGGLPEGNKHCALMSVNAVRIAIRDYYDHKREPWKKLYNKH